MRSINIKISKELVDKYKMAEATKEGDLTSDKRIQMYKEIRLKQEKIDFYKKLNNALREANQNEPNKMDIK